MAPKLAPKKQTPAKKTAEPKSNTKKNKKSDPVPESKEDPLANENTAIPEIDEEELKQMKIIQEEEQRQSNLRIGQLLQQVNDTKRQAKQEINQIKEQLAKANLFGVNLKLFCSLYDK